MGKIVYVVGLRSLGTVFKYVKGLELVLGRSKAFAFRVVVSDYGGHGQMTCGPLWQIWNTLRKRQRRPSVIVKLALREGEESLRGGDA
jgi:hypothetical protein